MYTLCLYHGEDEWDGPRSLQDMMKFEGEDDVFRKWFNDYPMRLYCLDEAGDFSLYRTEVGTLFRALRYRKDRPGLRKLLESDPNYRHLDKDTLEAMAILLKIPKLWEKRDKFMSKNEGREEYDMCQAIREWAEEERRIGLEEGRVTIIKNLIRRGDTDEEIMQVVECSREYLVGIRETACIL